MTFSFRIGLLENQLCAELNVTVVGGCRSYVTERSGIPSRTRVCKVRMVEDIEHFGAELEFGPLLDGEILEDRKVSVHKSGSIKDIASRVAEGELRRQSKGRGVNATDEVAGATVLTWRSYKIGTLIGATDVGLIWRDDHVERGTGLRGENTVGLPITERPAQKWTAAAEGRQVVDEAGNEPMTNIPVSVTVVQPPLVVIHGRTPAVGIRGNVESVRPSVAGQYLNVAAHALTKDCG